MTKDLEGQKDQVLGCFQPEKKKEKSNFLLLLKHVKYLGYFFHSVDMRGSQGVYVFVSMFDSLCPMKEQKKPGHTWGTERHSAANNLHLRLC